jgi:hypothetical protein
MSVFSQRMATRLKRLSLPIACSMRARSLYRRFGEKTPSLLGVFAVRDNWCDAARTCRGSDGRAVISLVGYRNARADVGADVERGLELCARAGLAASQVEVERVAIKVSLEVDFGRETAARAPERLTMLPRFAPAAET